MFLCIPLFFGFPTKLNFDANQSPRICPRCHNASVNHAKSRTWFEFCFVPLIPFSRKHVWICAICQWQVPLQNNWEPTLPNNTHPVGAPPNQGYQPSYLNQSKLGG